VDTFRKLVRFIKLSTFVVLNREGCSCDIRICLVSTRDSMRSDPERRLVHLCPSHSSYVNLPAPLSSHVTVPLVHILHRAVGGQMILRVMRLWNRCLIGSC
jgi:hypothetical protein